MGISSVRGLVARAAFAPVLVFAIIACEDALSLPDDLGPSFGDTIVQVFRVPVVEDPVFNPCTGEDVTFSGTITVRELHVMGGGAAVFCLTQASSGDITGTGPSGDTYRVVAFSHREILQLAPDTDLTLDRLQFVNTRGGGVFFAKALVSIRNAEGAVTVSMEVTDIVGCRGGRN